MKNLKSLLSIALIQGANFLFPAATLPFLIRYLGAADYGVFNLSQTWALYFSVIIAYGFDLSATKDVATGNKTASELSSIYSKVYYSKLLLFSLSFIVFCSIVFLNIQLRGNFLIYLIMFLWTLNTVFFQSWLFLGLEKQSIVSLFYLISRAGSFLIILILIFFKVSLLTLVIAYSIPQAIIAIAAHGYTIRKYSIKLKIISVAKIVSYLKHSFVLFLSTVAGTITVSLSVILLGFLSTEESVGYFGVSTKLVSLIYGLVLFPFQIVFFPVIVRKVKENNESGLRYFIRLLIGACTLMGLCCFAVFLFSDIIIKLFVGDGFIQSVHSLKIVCFIPLFALANTLLGYLLVAMEKRMQCTAILFLGSIMCFVLNILLIPQYDQIGSAFAWLLAEVVCFLTFVGVLIKNEFSKVHSLKLKHLNE